MSDSSVRIETRLAGRLADLDTVHGVIAEFACRADLGDSIVTPLRLALDELVTNVVEHGFRGRDGCYLLLILEARAEVVCATIVDDGPAFDPTGTIAVDTAADLSARPIGGLGLHLVRKSVDAVEYERRGEFNRLTVSLHRPAMGPATS